MSRRDRGRGLRGAVAMSLAHLMLYLPLMACRAEEGPAGKADGAALVAESDRQPVTPEEEETRPPAAFPPSPFAASAEDSAGDTPAEVPGSNRFVSPAASRPAAIPPEEALERLDRFLELIEELRSHIDRSQFDLEALLEKLDYDHEEIVRFVTEEIAFEQYPGLLRGARGTLMSRAGNALDQAVLLATLLKDAGYEARIVGGVLDELEARRLLLETRRRTPQSEAFDKAAVAQLVSNLGDADAPARMLRADDLEPKPDARSLDRISANKELLTRLVPAVAPSSSGAKQWIQEARDYYWVEYMTGQGAWTPAHPTMADDRLDEKEVAAIEYFADEIPSRLLHRVAIRISIKGFEGKWEPVMDWWERPAANLTGRVLSIALLPDQLLRPDARGNAFEALLESKFFLPLLNGGLAPGAQAFDLEGLTVPPDSIDSAAGYFVKEVSDKGLSAANALSALDGEQEPRRPRLQGVKLEWAVTSPGEPTKTIERRILDEGWARRGDALEAGKQRLATVHWFTVDGGSISEGLAFDQSLAFVSDLEDAMRVAIGLDAGSASRDDLASALQSVPMHRPALLGLQHEIQRREWVDGRGSIYRDAPGVVALSEPILPGAGWGFYGVDVVSDSIRALGRVDGEIIVRKDLALEYGVRESLLEAYAASWDEEPQSAFHLLDKARSDGVSFIVVEGEEMASELKLPQRTHSQLLSELAAGYVVVAPRSVGEGAGVWWRVDRSTGNALAQFADGPGGSPIAEYLKVGLISFGGTYWFLTARSGCLDSGNSSLHCTICGLMAGATAAIAIWVVIPTGATVTGHQLISMLLRRLLYRRNSAAYLKALVLALGPAAAGVCGTKTLIK